MYLKINDFIEDWKVESESTIKIYSNISDEVMSNKDHENIRSLEKLAWHITQTLTELPKSCGITENDALENMEIPKSISEIISLYKLHSAKLIEVIQNKWTDNDLTKELKVYGQEWEARNILSMLVKHQIHHRAQMTVLMRMYDVKVPGIYGPSKEEWTQYGMDAQD